MPSKAMNLQSSFTYDNLGRRTLRTLHVFTSSPHQWQPQELCILLIGNRLTANENSTVTNYTSNLLNQYTLINNTAPGFKINHCVFRCGLWSKPICPAGQDKSITSPDEYDIHGNREDCHLMHDHGIFRAKGFLQEAYQRYPTNLADLCRTLPYACSLF